MPVPSFSADPSPACLFSHDGGGSVHDSGWGMQGDCSGSARRRGRRTTATIAMASACAALQLQRQCLAAAIDPLIFSGHGLRYRKLEVILTTLGKAGEVVKLAPGHLRNHLMPKMLAVLNIDKFAILIREQRKSAIVGKHITPKDIREEMFTKESGNVVAPSPQTEGSDGENPGSLSYQ